VFFKVIKYFFTRIGKPFFGENHARKGEEEGNISDRRKHPSERRRGVIEEKVDTKKKKL